jgi:hypothetical protein
MHPRDLVIDLPQGVELRTVQDMLQEDAGHAPALPTGPLQKNRDSLTWLRQQINFTIAHLTRCVEGYPEIVNLPKQATKRIVAHLFKTLPRRATLP